MRRRIDHVPAAAPTSLLSPDGAARGSRGSSTRGAAVDADDLGREMSLAVWRLAWPAIGHMLLLTMVFAVDRLVLGRTDTTALASLQISTVVVWTLTTIFTAFSTGTLAVAGRAFGAGDRSTAARAVAVSLGLSLVMGAVVAVAMLALGGPLLRAAFPRAGEAVLVDVARYLWIVGPALPLVFIEATSAAALQAAGDTRTPLVVAALSNVANLVLSCVLVFGLFGAPAIGVRGAALGALAAILLQAAGLLVALLRRGCAIPVRDACSSLRATWRAMVRRLFDVSLPAFADKVVYAGGYLIFVALVAWLGPTAMAANQAVVSVEAVCFLSAEGFGIAAGALAAQNLGAGAPARAEHAARAAAAMAVALLSIFGALFVLAPRALLGAFSSDRAIVEAASSALLLAAVAQPFMAYATVMRMALRGAGATGVVLLVTLGATFLVRIPVAYAASFVGDWGLTGIWMASTLDWIVQAVAFGGLFRGGRWKQASA